ncbi:MAG: hypothetical protein LQ339_002320 [Xanthoria mediterranea]|nr:MAG: hypothetical protein LQ339_002320 [Xanthoria mediterranea]
MRSFSSTAVIEPSSASNRRQPVRQTRTNPSRSANIGAPQRGLGVSQTAAETTQNAKIGFFPAITHFTDAISALPKEMVRHYSMLKEVDAKICGPEEAIGQLVAAALQIPAPPRKIQNVPPSIDASNPDTDATQSTADNISLRSVPSRVDAASTASQEDLAVLDRSRRQLFDDLRRWMQEMLPILDEKNHVLSAATDCLENQLKRCNSSYRHIDDEVSEESRYGSLTHWAYIDKTAEKKGTTAGERTRRDAVIANHLAATAPAAHETEGAALRSELRREAMAARKHRNQHLESDFDEVRAAPQSTGKRSQGMGKGRKAVEAASITNGSTVGLGIANGMSTAAPPAKRRKVDKSAASLGGIAPVRGMSLVYGGNMGSARGVGTSPQTTPNLEPPKKRGRTAAATNGTGRKRANTNTSAVNSPSIASSPVVGTFSTPKDVQRRSPAPSLMQRIPSSRGRQNSTQSVLQEPRSLPASKISNKSAAGSSGNPSTPATVDKTTTLVAGSSDIKPWTKEPAHSKDHIVAESRPGEGELRGGLASGSRGTDKSMKKEDAADTPITNKNRPDRPRSISISTRGGNNNKTSKTSTPTQGSFNNDGQQQQQQQQQRTTRPTRNADPAAKRSHKKGAGLAAQLVAAQLNATEDDEMIQGDEEEEEGGDSEPRYCYCNQVSYGEMVACDMDSCPREWFHLDCLGLAKAPKGNAKWFCDECKENLKKGKATNGNGR